MAKNPLYEYYANQANKSPLSQMSMNSQKTQAAGAGDMDFQDIWKYLKWLRKGYDTYANFSGNPTSAEYLGKAWDWGSDTVKDWLSSKGAETAAEYGTQVGTDLAADYAGLSGAELGTQAGSQLATDAATTGATEAATSYGVGEALNAVAPYIPVLGVAYNIWSKYTGGSHQNTPLMHRNEGLGALRYLTDQQSGQNQGIGEGNYGRFDPFRSASNYNQGLTEEERNSGSYQKMNPYDIFMNTVMDNSRYGGGKNINNTMSPQDIYAAGSQYGLDWDKLGDQLGGVSFKDWGNPDFDYLSWRKIFEPQLTTAYNRWQNPNEQTENVLTNTLSQYPEASGEDLIWL